MASSTNCDDSFLGGTIESLVKRHLGKSCECIEVQKVALFYVQIFITFSALPCDILWEMTTS